MADRAAERGPSKRDHSRRQPTVRVRSIFTVKRGLNLRDHVITSPNRTRTNEAIAASQTRTGYSKALQIRNSLEDTLLPQIIVEPLQRRVRILHILLRLLAHVKDGAILCRTQDVLSKTRKQTPDPK